MKKLIVCALTLLCFLLASCTNFAPFSSPTTPSSKLTSSNKKPRSSERYTKNTSDQGNSAQISVNDFTNLNLNNYGTSSGNLWEKIQQGLKIPNPEDRPEVQAQIRWFMAHPGYLQRTTERARPYLFTVYQEVESRGLPTELVLLPINESAYYPFSYSSAGATGIWQLMPGAANDYGLKHNFWYDGRRDIFDSTNAALDYLTYLAHYFNGDWLLAIAAYNTGEGNVERAIARNVRDGQPTDFWSLHLAEQTRTYVPKLLALAAIVEHPDRYPVPLPPVDAKPVVESVPLGQQLKLTDAAKLAGISITQLKSLNPGLRGTATDPAGDTKLVLPIDTVASFKDNLNDFHTSITSTTSQAPGHYRVQRGDTLASIANRFNISVDELREANNLLGRSVPRGKILLIPNTTDNFKPETQIDLNKTPLRLSSPQEMAKEDTNSDDDNTPAPPAKHVLKHKVLKGETLASISRKYKVSIHTLTRLNPGIDRHPLHAGQVIIISETNKPILSTTPPKKTLSHPLKKKTTAKKSKVKHSTKTKATH